MELRRLAARTVAVCAGLMLGACVAQTPAPQTTSVESVAFAPPAANWQWSDAPAGPTVTLSTTDVTPAAGATRMASLALVCSDALPAIVVSWDAPVARPGQAGLSYRFGGQPAHDVAAEARDPGSTVVSDPIVVSRFIDEAAVSQQLVVRAGATEATFTTTDDAGNLRRFRTACPDGTN